MCCDMGRTTFAGAGITTVAIPAVAFSWGTLAPSAERFSFLNMNKRSPISYYGTLSAEFLFPKQSNLTARRMGRMHICTFPLFVRQCAGKTSRQPSVPGNCFAPDQKRPRDSPNDCGQERVPPKWHGMAACSAPTFTYIFYHPSPTSQQKFHRFRLKVRSFFFTMHGICENRRHCTWANLWYNYLI